MKKFILRAMFAVTLISTATSLSSCSDDDNNEPNNGGTTTGEVVTLGATSDATAKLASNMTIKADDTNKLQGHIIVPAGITLTIEAGATIKAEPAFSSYILVEQGGKIIANGTASNPIVFTKDESSTAEGKYWGGIIINGYAPLSGPTGTTGSTEINADYVYGGTNAEDTSGTLNYVKLLYTGAGSPTDPDKEHNGLTLNGVGNGTTISNIFVQECGDDGIEFFGGSVNVTNYMVVNADDDMFDFTQGYTGTLTNAYGVSEAGLTSAEDDPRGVEADGNHDGKNPEYDGQSDFTIDGLTLNFGSTDLTIHDGIKIRRGAKATINNAVILGEASVKDLIDLADKKGLAAPGTSISVLNKLVNPAGDILELVGKDGDVVKFTGDAADYTVDTNATGNTGADLSAFSWTGYNPDENAAEAETKTFGSTNDDDAKLTEDLTIRAIDTNKLNGHIIVSDGTKLKIEAGATILCEPGFGTYILVEQGGEIEADGTATSPIVFKKDDSSTSEDKYWGGIIINGYAPLSGPSAGTTGSTEINADFMYGGTDASDDSGSMKYVKLINTGASNPTDPDKEHNGLTLNGVGNGTTIENIMIQECGDDGIEFFGGSVNVTNYLVINADDDMFDFTQGYTGTLTNAYGVSEAGLTSEEDDPRGIEADGNHDGKNPEYDGQSDFTINNVTLQFGATGLTVHDAIKIRRGAKATITNALVKGASTVKDFIDIADKKGLAAAGTSISYKNALDAFDGDLIELVGKDGEVVKFTGDINDYTITEDTEATGADVNEFSWTGYTF